MSEKIIESNQVNIAGEVVSDFSFSHEIFGERFFVLSVSVKRLSGYCDVIPLMVSERLIDVNRDFRGEYIRVSGQFRSYNSHETCKNRLILYVFAREIDDSEKYDDNHIFLDGFICKKPIYRKTPLGREIADILLAVNRPYGKTDYIPCILWGRNARFASCFKVGYQVEINGRIQSREYNKKNENGEMETKIAYEVSTSKVTWSKD